MRIHSSKRVIGLSLTALLFISPMGMFGPAFALTGFEVVSGDATLSQTGDVWNVTSTSQAAIVQWQTFNVGANQTVNFILPDVTASLLNRILGGPSTILGRINSNGTVLLSNTAGIRIGQSAAINAAGFVASSLKISDQNYLSNNWTFTRDPNGNPASVINEGDITTAPGGFVVLSGAAVANSGNIFAPDGTVHLAVGDTIRMQVGPNHAVDVTIDDALQAKIDGLQVAIANSGDINARTVELQAKLSESLYEHVINTDGVIRTTGAVREGATIRLYGVTEDGTGIVFHEGVLDASQVAFDGGTVHILGDHLVMAGDIIANGVNGGTVLIGGDYQGKDTLHHATTTTVTETASLQANAIADGDGGKVIAWADDHTRFDGHAEARGGALGGDGGLIETSGKQTLIVGQSAMVDASAANGIGGLWLLDPTNLTINSGAGGDTSSNVYANNIQTTLNTGTSVTVQTSGAGGGNGHINVNDGVSINKTGGGEATLRLNAHENIQFNGTAGPGINIASSSGKLNLILNADTDATNGGAIRLNYTTIDTNNGDIIMGGGADPLTTAAIGTSSYTAGIRFENSTLSTGTGDMALRGQGRNDAGTSYHHGVLVSTNSALSTTSGDITITGTGGNGAANNYGVWVYNGADISTVDGNLNITGTGGNSAGGSNEGIRIQDVGSTVSATGTGNVTLTGTGGTGTTSNFGVYVVNGGAVSTVDGSLNVTGTGGNGTGSYNQGIRIQSAGSTVRATGTGDVTLTGIGGTGTSINFGVWVVNGGDVSTVDGSLNVTGTGGNGTLNNNEGIRIESAGSTVRATGTGDVTLTGTGGTGTSSHYGVLVYNGGAASTVDGSLSINGTGGTGTSNNFGVWVYNGGRVSTVDGSLNVTGRGGTGTLNSNEGIRIESAGSTVYSAGSGDVTLTGIGGTGVAGNRGVFIFDNSNISTVDGNLSLTGTGGNGSSTSNHGVSLHTNGTVTSTSGNITLTGTKGGFATDVGISNEAGTNDIGSGTMTGTITLNGDTMNLAGTTVQTTGGVTLANRTAGTTIGLGTGTGTLSLTDAVLDDVISSSLTIGSGTAGDIALDGVNLTGQTMDLTLQTAGSILDGNAGATNLTTDQNATMIAGGTLGTNADALEVAITDTLSVQANGQDGTGVSMNVDGTIGTLDIQQTQAAPQFSHNQIRDYYAQTSVSKQPFSGLALVNGVAQRKVFNAPAPDHNFLLRNNDSDQPRNALGAQHFDLNLEPLPDAAASVSASLANPPVNPDGIEAADHAEPQPDGSVRLVPAG